jgi:hypothetical protein
LRATLKGGEELSVDERCRVEFSDLSALSQRGPVRVPVNNPVHNNPLSLRGFSLGCLQFIERTESVGSNRKKEVE